MILISAVLLTSVCSMNWNGIFKFSAIILVFFINVDVTQGVDCTRTVQCLRTFLENYPLEDQQNLLLSFPDEITYICVTQNASIQCVDQGLDSCQSAQQILKEQNVDATRYRNFLREQCPKYNTVFKNQATCVKFGLQSSGYLTCANGVAQKNPLPANKVITSCQLYNGVLGCLDNALGSCGQPAINYLKEGIKLRWTLPTSTCNSASAVTSINVLTLFSSILICMNLL